jgi:hypothetical protein
VVAQNSPHKDLKSLVEYGQKNPGKLTYGSAGNGSASHLATVLLGQMAKLEAAHVPYRGASPALTDLIGGRTDFMITTMPSVLGLIEGSQVRPIGVTSKERSRKFPDVPSVAESGFPGYEATAWYGFVVPKGTPKEINEAIRKATLETIKGRRGPRAAGSRGRGADRQHARGVRGDDEGGVGPLGRDHQGCGHQDGLTGDGRHPGRAKRRAGTARALALAPPATARRCALPHPRPSGERSRLSPAARPG